MQKILILDFGGQFNQLIARRVREQQVYCELHPHSMTLDEIRRFDPIGIIFTGGPHSLWCFPFVPKRNGQLFRGSLSFSIARISWIARFAKG